ncbi:hypothetical protein Mpsy_1323 [Methanolobus psychrophilus R15]|nr:hypothetical protein Mpsy_1323 [Methanolobus psychrophilus R15]
MSARIFYEKIGGMIGKSPKRIIFLAIAMMFVSLYGAGMIEHKSRTDTFAKKNSKIYLDYNNLFKQNFGSEVIVALVEPDNVMGAETLKAIDNFDLIIERDKNVENAMSMAK